MSIIDKISDCFKNFTFETETSKKMRKQKELQEKLNSEEYANVISEEELYNEISEYLANENPERRIKDLFKTSEITAQLPYKTSEWLARSSSVGFLGFLLGAILHSNYRSQNFKDANKVALYTNRKAAHRAYYDYLIMETIKGGSKVGFKYLSFVSAVLGYPLIMSAYRNQSSPIDYVVGGALSGGLYRMHLGLYNLLVGSIAGAIVGSISGELIYNLDKFKGTLYEDIKFKEIGDKIIEKKKLEKYYADRMMGKHSE